MLRKNMNKALMIALIVTFVFLAAEANFYHDDKTSYEARDDELKISEVKTRRIIQLIRKKQATSVSKNAPLGKEKKQRPVRWPTPQRPP